MRLLRSIRLKRTVTRPSSTPGSDSAESYLRRPWRPASRRTLPLLLGAVVVFSVLSLVLGNRGVAQLWELAWRQRELRTELGNLERAAANLSWELGESGSMAVERPARERFHMQRPGEIVYYFPQTGSGRALRPGANTGRAGSFPGDVVMTPSDSSNQGAGKRE